jgi:hypothetical protein
VVFIFYVELPSIDRQSFYRIFRKIINGAIRPSPFKKDKNSVAQTSAKPI